VVLLMPKAATASVRVASLMIVFMWSFPVELFPRKAW
jgi:hypothetical protein